jgi:hypothetical protein
MRIVAVLGIALPGLFVIGAVTAYGQINMHSQYSGTTATVVDDKGNLRVPSDYRTARMLGSWAVAKDDGPGSKQLHVVYASPGTIAGPTEARPADGLAIDFVLVSDRAQLSEIVQRVRDG